MAGRRGAAAAAAAGKRMIFGMSEAKFKNAVVAGSLSAFVASVYVYTMKAVGGTDELQAAVESFEREKASKSQSEARWT